MGSEFSRVGDLIRRVRLKGAICRPGRGFSLDLEHAGTLILGFRPLEERGIKVCSGSLPPRGLGAECSLQGGIR